MEYLIINTHGTMEIAISVIATGSIKELTDLTYFIPITPKPCSLVVPFKATILMQSPRLRNKIKKGHNMSYYLNIFPSCSLLKAVLPW